MIVGFQTFDRIKTFKTIMCLVNYHKSKQTFQNKCKNYNGTCTVARQDKTGSPMYCTRNDDGQASKQA